VANFWHWAFVFNQVPFVFNGTIRSIEALAYTLYVSYVVVGRWLHDVLLFYSAGMSKRSLNMDFLQHLRDALLRPMINDGSDGVQESVKVTFSLNNKIDKS
jgi:hypothetical protein